VKKGWDIMDAKMISFIERLNEGQPYLLLGQQYLSDSVTKKFYEKVSNKLKGKARDCNIFLEMSGLTQDIDKTLQWIQTEADNITLPEWGRYLSKVRWNGIITSSVDNFIERMLQLEMKSVQPVYNFEKKLLDNFKSKDTLHISYLYGCLNQISENEKPPCSVFKLPSHEKNASMLLNQIDREFLSPMGVLVIDGYDYKNDWLNIKELYALCEKLDKGQVFFFGFKDEYMNNQYIKKLIDDGIIVYDNKSLISVLEEVCESGLLEYDEEYVDSEGIVISVKGERRLLKQDKFKEISKTCKILNDFEFEFNDISNEEEKELFYDFLCRSSVEPVWEAFYHKMNVIREYENNAMRVIEKSLNSEKLSKKPIIICGQSGTGKSVALASLAYRLKKGKKYPVLYVDGRVVDISRNKRGIEEFCSWCDDVNVAVFWDASTHGNDINKYANLNDYLASKGKKAVIVGTSYNLDDNIKNRQEALCIEAPIEITEQKEIENFKEIYERFVGEKLEELWTSRYDNNFLVALYRMLPPTNYHIRKGILKEVNVDTIELSELVTFRDNNTDIAKLIQKCGFPISLEPEHKESNKIKIGEVIKIVSMIGQYGITIPFDIVFRMLDGDISYYVGKLLHKIDFLNVKTSKNGDLYLCPRSSLEANIVANSTMVGVGERVEIVIKVVKNVTEKELSFLVTFLKAIGPNSTTKNGEYREYYINIAEAVEELRTKEGIYDISTILQEASYIREYFKNSDEKEKYLEVLKEKQNLLSTEIKKIKNKTEELYGYGQLLIEVSSNIGAELMFYCNNSQMYLSEISKKYEELKKYLEEALICSPDPYYPVDIWAWTSNSLIATDISDDKKIEIASDLESRIEKLRSENPEIEERVDYNTRILKLDNLKSLEDVKDETFERFLEKKSDVGIYLRARQLLDGIDINKKVSDINIKIVGKAIDYLEQPEFKDIVINSTKCQYLLLKLYWIKMAGKPFFVEEKKVLKFDLSVWERLYTLLINIETLEGESSVQVMYLRCLCEFHLGRIDECFQHFGEIRMRNYYYLGSRNPILYYIASKDGNAQEFSGEIKKIERDKGRVKFYLKSIRKELWYYNKDFSSSDLGVGQVYNGIHIGFSFMGIRISDIQ